MSGEAQQAWFGCGYPLDGLPRPYRCPECGLAFDDDTLVFRPHWPRRLIAFALIVGLLTLPMVASWFVADVSFRRNVHGVAALVGLSMLVVLLIGILRARTTRPFFVAMTRDGFVVKTTRAPMRRIPYGDIVRVIGARTPVLVVRQLEAPEDSPFGTKTIELLGIFESDESARTFSNLAYQRIGGRVCEEVAAEEVPSDP